jgi:hypothetical protein
MRIAMWSCVLSSLLSTAAFAQGAPSEAPFAFNAAGVSTSAPDDQTGARIGVEILGGGLGAVGGGFTGLMIGASGGTLAGAGLGMLSGIAVGSWLGTSVGGNAVGGQGNWGASFLGTLGGSVASLMVGAAIGNNPDAGGFLLAMMMALPVGGGILGYELSHSMAITAPGGPLRSVHPTFSLGRDGKSPMPGLAGTF